MWPFNKTLAFYLSSISFYLYDSGEKSALTVETSYGKLEGLSSVSRSGKEFFEFLGIPYAKPPVGDLRFAPPVLPEPWNGTRDATFTGSPCLQMNLFTRMQEGSEDCLFLNVFTHQIQNSKKDLPVEKLHPVLLFLHGGLFMCGSSEYYRPKYFMDEDVVLVTMNYRLAAFGFLNFGHKEAAGNMGLKDQVMALRWIQENIHYFGGDPNSVTIMGESSGAASAHFHTLSNMTKGLFHRTIAQSGTAISAWALNSNPIQQAEYFSAKLNCTRNTTAESIKCLKALDSNVLVKAQLAALYIPSNRMDFFAPSVETVINSETFISEHPSRLQPVNKVPQFSGANSNEGLMFAALMIKNETTRVELNQNWTHWAPIFLGFEHEPQPKKDVISIKIWNYYLSGSEEGISMQAVENVTNLMSDRGFFYSLHKVALSNNNVDGSSPLFLYYYSYRSKFSLGKLMFGMTGDLPVIIDGIVTYGVQWFSRNLLGRDEKHYGTCHGDEVFLMYDIPYFPEHKKGTPDNEMSTTLIKLWCSFARDGAPSHVQNYHWLPVQPKKNCSSNESSDRMNKYMKLDSVAEFIDEPFYERMKFWDSLNISIH